MGFQDLNIKNSSWRKSAICLFLTSGCSKLDYGVTDGGREVEESKHSFGTKQLARKFS